MTISSTKTLSDAVPGQDALPEDGTFKDVDHTLRLLNSYLSVYYKHAAITTARDLYRGIFDECVMSVVWKGQRGRGSIGEVCKCQKTWGRTSGCFRVYKRGLGGVEDAGGSGSRTRCADD